MVTAAMNRFLELEWGRARSLAQASGHGGVVVVVMGPRASRASCSSSTTCEFGVCKMFLSLCPQLLL